MKKIGIALMLCWPALVILGALSGHFVPKEYSATSFVDHEVASMEEFKQAFEQVAPKSQDITIEPVENTDLVAITVRDLKSQAAVDRVNSVAAKVVEKLGKTVVEKVGTRTFQLPRVAIPVKEASPPPRPIVWANVLVGAVLGLFPAVIGLVLFLLGRRPHDAVTPVAQIA